MVPSNAVNDCSYGRSPVPSDPNQPVDMLDEQAFQTQLVVTDPALSASTKRSDALPPLLEYRVAFLSKVDLGRSRMWPLQAS